MADFYGCLSSTSFRVKDEATFLADSEVLEIKKYAKENGGFFDSANGYVAFGWYGQYPSLELQFWDNSAKPDEPREIDLSEVVQRHILSGDACVIGISGNEKLRYIGGPLLFVTSVGTACFNGEVCWEAKETVESVKQRAEAFALEVRRLMAEANTE